VTGPDLHKIADPISTTTTTTSTTTILAEKSQRPPAGMTEGTVVQL